MRRIVYPGIAGECFAPSRHGLRAVFAGRSVSATSVSGLRQRWKEVSLRAQLTQKGTRRRLPERRDRRALRCHASFAVA
jgi:hypothetical protein